MTWDSLRLLTPNWATRLPGWSYQGPTPDGYMTRRRGGRATSPTTPARSTPRSRTGADVARPARGRRRLRRRRRPAATGGPRNVVIATGWCDQPHVPALRRAARPRRHPAHAEHLPQPGPAARRPGARRGRLGHRRADRRRARPRRPRRRARRRPPQPGAPPLPRHGHLVVARPDRHLRRTIDEMQRPVAGARARARSSSSAAATTATSTCPRCSASACG